MSDRKEQGTKREGNDTLRHWGSFPIVCSYIPESEFLVSAFYKSGRRFASGGPLPKRSISILYSLTRSCGDYRGLVIAGILATCDGFIGVTELNALAISFARREDFGCRDGRFAESRECNPNALVLRWKPMWVFLCVESSSWGWRPAFFMAK
jgi:hypothetical protein